MSNPGTFGERHHRQRVNLFEEYCLTSVRAQVSQDFTWIIYFDPQTSAWLRERIDERTRDGSYTPIFRASVGSSELVEDMRRLVGTPGTTLPTTNVDNDDGLAIDLRDRLQKAVTPHERAAIYLINGLIKSQNGLYLHTDRHNAFCSVREGWESTQTCWSDWHNLPAQSMATLEVVASRLGCRWCMAPTSATEFVAGWFLRALTSPGSRTSLPMSACRRGSPDP